MLNFRRFSGGAMPSSWSMAVPKELGARAADFKSFLPPEPIDLVADTGGYDTWKVRDQGHRSTCTAFAVAAAEELVNRTHHRDRNVQLSVEHLYSQIRMVPLSDTGIKLEDREAVAIVQSGATFIKQAELALLRGGTAPETLMPYDVGRPASFFEMNITQDALDAGQAAKPQQQDLTHNIVDVEGGDLWGDMKIWKTPLTLGPVSEVFLNALRDKYPVVAGFVMLSGLGIGSWLGQRAVRYGEVIYPNPPTAETLRKYSGHVVCITGFIPSDDETINAGGPRGYFKFKNSYGAFGFARDRALDATPPSSPARGYGIISTDDVDRYCWEYMYRTGHGA